jgi:hypothetical protein
MLMPSAQQYPQVPPEEVRIFTTQAELEDYEYDRVAIIHGTGQSGWTSDDGMISALREKAGDVGANAILLPEVEDASAGEKFVGALLGTGAQRKGEVIAIRVHNPNWE